MKLYRSNQPSGPQGLKVVLPDHISAPRKVRAGIRVRNLKRWIPSFGIHLASEQESGFDSILYFPSFPGDAATDESVDLYFKQRGAAAPAQFPVLHRLPFRLRRTA